MLTETHQTLVARILPEMRKVLGESTTVCFELINEVVVGAFATNLLESLR